MTWHHYHARTGSAWHYGHEWNAQIGCKTGASSVSFLAKFADYRRKGVADFAGDADTDKLWLQLDYTL